MLIGNYSSSLIQRRIAVPKKFRLELGKKYIVAKWYENCLVLVSAKNWQQLIDRLGGPGKMVTAPVRDTDRFILGSAFELTADSQGRILLPEQLVEYAKLTSEVTFLGLGERVEIWDKRGWEEREKFISSHASEFIEELAKVNE